MGDLDLFLLQLGIGQLDGDLAKNSVAVLIGRFVSDQILRPHLVLDLVKRLTQLAFVPGKICPSAGSLRYFIQRPAVDAAVKIVADPDRIDDRLGP